MVVLRRYLRRFRVPLVTVLLAALAGVAVLSPLHHHDVVCHLQSPTHCTTCLISAAADDPSALEAVSGNPLAAIWSVATRHDATHDPDLFRDVSGRSPPVRG